MADPKAPVDIIPEDSHERLAVASLMFVFQPDGVAQLMYQVARVEAGGTAHLSSATAVPDLGMTALGGVPNLDVVLLERKPANEAKIRRLFPRRHRVVEDVDFHELGTTT
jgi:hypothetical protein